MVEFTAVRSLNPLRLESPLTEQHKRTEAYIPATGLAEAMDVAMWLGLPLLLTGDPGTGKTRAAYWLADSLQVEPLLRYDVKSTSTGADLLFFFDEVARFRDSTRREKWPLVRYLRFNALGEAILRAAGGQACLQTMTGDELEGEALRKNRKLLVDAFGEDCVPKSGAATAALLMPDDESFAHSKPEHRVVLIDEIDKAPRDTPNDLLSEIEEMEFAIPELGIKIKAVQDFRPIVIITSNAEKSLPDPFLRRCVYFDIPFPRRYVAERDGEPPGKGTLEAIVESRIEELAGGGPLLAEALDLFQQLRRPETGLRKAPGIAELLGWLDVVVHRYKFSGQGSFGGRTNVVEPSLGAVLKSKEDVEMARRVVAEWAKRLSR